MEPLALHPLNVLIGPNCSGKTNFIEAMEVLRALPTDVQQAVKTIGGYESCVWSGEITEQFSSDTEFEIVVGPASWRREKAIRYSLVFSDLFGPSVIQEAIQEVGDDGRSMDPPLYSFRPFESAVISARTGASAETRVVKELEAKTIEYDQSILSQVKEPRIYPELHSLGEDFSGIRTFREWVFGTRNTLRLPQRADDPTDELLPDGRNLALVLNENSTSRPSSPGCRTETLPSPLRTYVNAHLRRYSAVVHP